MILLQPFYFSSNHQKTLAIVITIATISNTIIACFSVKSTKVTFIEFTFGNYLMELLIFVIIEDCKVVFILLFSSFVKDLL